MSWLDTFVQGAPGPAGPAGSTGPAGAPQAWNIRNVTFASSPVTAASGDWIVCDATNGDIAVTVPSALNALVRTKLISGPHQVAVAPDARLVDGSPSASILLPGGTLDTTGQGPAVGVYIT